MVIRRGTTFNKGAIRAELEANRDVPVACGQRNSPAICWCMSATGESFPPQGQPLSRSESIVRGAWGFGVTGVVAFSIWALAGGWFGHHGGEGFLYAAIAFAFLGLAGLLLHPLISGPGSFRRFYLLFIPAFLAYSVIWSAAWFAAGFGWGEVLGSLVGSLAFVAVLGRFRGGIRPFLAAGLVLFVVHFSTYWIGGQIAYRLMGPHGSDLLPGVDAGTRALIAKLLWGLFYGTGFGAGLGNALFVFRN